MLFGIDVGHHPSQQAEHSVDGGEGAQLSVIGPWYVESDCIGVTDVEHDVADCIDWILACLHIISNRHNINVLYLCSISDDVPLSFMNSSMLNTILTSVSGSN